MQNNNKFPIAFLFMFLFIFVNNTSSYANAIRVFKDGTELLYESVSPQIIDNRTMVPLAQTAEYFGMNYVWNPEISTMVFTGNGRTMVHTVYSNIIYVNAYPIEFDFSSTIVNDRTLMPIRMLAEAIGCVVEWDDSGIVNIWSEIPEITPPLFETPIEIPMETSDPSEIEAITIYSATKDRPTIVLEQSIVVTVITNKSADRVKITDRNGNEILQSSDFYDDQEGRHFVLEIEPQEIGEIFFRAYAGNIDGYTLGFEELSVIVTEPIRNVFIDNLKLESNTVSYSGEVGGVMYTSKNVAEIVIEDENGVIIKSIDRYKDVTSNTLQWEFYFYPESTSGEYTYYAIAYDRDKDFAKKSFTITVEGKEVSSSNTSIEIIDIDHDNTASYDTNYRVSITTNNAVREIEIYDENDNLMVSSTNSSAYGSNKIWNLDFYPDYSGRYYIYAYGDNQDEQIFQSIHINVE